MPLEPNEPACVADVTLAIRFSLDPNLPGLYIPKMSTKQNLMGFFNPIPPFKKEYENPVLCLIYTIGEAMPDPQRDVVAANLHITFYSDRQEVKILVPGQ